MRSSLKPWVVALGLALVAEFAPAAGFGKININSALGQPLSAEIDLLNVSPEDLVGMQVRLASPDAFREANVEYSQALSGVRFVLDRRPGGQPFIRVTSSQPISEPALNLLVEVTWPSGRLLRDYPVLLNPAGYSQDRAVAENAPRLPNTPPEVPIRQATPGTAVPAPAQPPVSVAESRPQPAPAREAAAPGRSRPAPVAKAETAPAPAPSPAPANSGTAAGGNYTIKPGDTLRGLAITNRPGSASLEQTMLAMFEANRPAFINDSIHRIRAGKPIHLPTEGEATAIPADEASRRVNLLASDFDAYRKRVADAAAARPAGGPADKGPATGKIATKTEDAAKPPKPPGSDVVQVSRSANASAKPGETGQAQRKTAADERATRMEEESIARENQLREARERVAQLESNLQQMHKLINDKGQPAGAAAPAAAATPPAAPAAPGPAVAAAPALALAPAISAPQQMQPAQPAPEAADKPAVPPPAKPAEPAAKPAAAETSFLDDLQAQLADNPLVIAAAVLCGLLVSWLGLNKLRRRRSRTEALFAQTSSAPEPITVNAVTSDKASELIDVPAGGYSSEFERVVPDHHPADEVDPVAEADVYIAYGRDVQAEEILREAMVKDPERTEILMKLLEIYAQRRSIEEYAQHALQLRQRVGTSHPLWSAAMAMGYEIDPENPLYHEAGEDFVPVAAPAPAAPAARGALDLDLTETQTGFGSPGVHEVLHTGEPLAQHEPDLTFTRLPTRDDHESSFGAFEIGEPDHQEAKGEPHEAAAGMGSATAGHPGAKPEEHTGHPVPGVDPEHGGELDAEAAETLRALSAITAESLRDSDATRIEHAPAGWPNLPEVAAYSGAAAGLSLAASNESVKTAEVDPFTLDIDLGDTAAKPAGASLAHGNTALDLGKIDLDLASEPAASSPPVLTLVPSSPAAPAVAAVPGESAAEARHFGDIDLDLKPAEPAQTAGRGSPAGESTAQDAPEHQSSQWHNVATKLDLARAYLEIGDKDGAREILREVTVEGDDAQRQEAERLAVQI